MNHLDTKIPWIENIPNAWKLVPLFVVADENKRKNKNKNENVLSLSYGKIIKRDLSKNFGLLPNNFDSYQVVDKDYIIIRSTDLQNDKKSLRVGLVKENGVITSAYIGLSPKKIIYPEYLFYYLNMCDLKKVFYSLGGGLRQSLRYEEFRRFPVVLPKFEEQIFISKYLDKKTQQIDNLIAKIEKKIELIKEQKTLLINQLVTKGLEHYLENKEVKDQLFTSCKLKYCLRQKVSDGPHETPNFQDSGVPFLSVDSIQNGKIVLENCRFISMNDHEKYNKKVKIEEDDILMGKAASIGKIARVTFNKMISVWSPLAVIKCKTDIINPIFLEYLLKSEFVQDQIQILATSNTQQNISMRDIERIKVIFPNLYNQNLISKYLDEKIKSIDSLIFKNNRKIDLLNEYRISLISSVITGKIQITEDML